MGFFKNSISNVFVNKFCRDTKNITDCESNSGLADIYWCAVMERIGLSLNPQTKGVADIILDSRGVSRDHRLGCFNKISGTLRLLELNSRQIIERQSGYISNYLTPDMVAATVEEIGRQHMVQFSAYRLLGVGVAASLNNEAEAIAVEIWSKTLDAWTTGSESAIDRWKRQHEFLEGPEAKELAQVEEMTRTECDNIPLLFQHLKDRKLA